MQPSAGSAQAANSGGSIDPRSLSYEDISVDLDAIRLRQLNEDLDAYKYDQNFCKAQLEQQNLTPQEARTLQLRCLDLGHQIRKCTHRMELLQLETRKSHQQQLQAQVQLQQRHGQQQLQAHRRQDDSPAAAAAGLDSGGTTSPVSPTALLATPADGFGGGAGAGGNGSGGGPGWGFAKRTGSFTLPTPPAVGHPGKKRGPGAAGGAAGSSAKRAKVDAANAAVAAMVSGADEALSPNTLLQRLGFWKCRLCTSAKYLNAGPNRVPSTPSKWPLKDLGKMITHFTELHTEHAPAERCAELGAALDQNRGPFEYWLKKSHSQNLGDGAVVNECVRELQHGRLPGLLRKLSRAAATFPVH